MKSSLLTKKTSFALFVALPTILTWIYLSFFAWESYETSSKLIVKEVASNQSPVLPGLAGAFLNFSNSTSAEDGYILREYILGKEFSELLLAETDVLKHFTANGFPFLQRLSDDSNIDEFHKYRSKKIKAHLSPDTGILELSTLSFEPGFGYQMALQTINFAEDKVNQLSNEIFDYRLEIAEKEYLNSENQFRAASQKLFEYKRDNNWLGNEFEIPADFERINAIRALITEKIIELGKMKASLDTSSPAVVALEDEISVLNGELDKYQSELTGGSDGSAISRSEDFVVIETEYELSREKFFAALTGLEQSKREAAQKQKFLVVVSAPVESVKSAYPEVILNTFTVLVVSFLIWILLRLIVATVRDHQI